MGQTIVYIMQVLCLDPKKVLTCAKVDGVGTAEEIRGIIGPLHAYLEERKATRAARVARDPRILRDRKPKAEPKAEPKTEPTAEPLTSKAKPKKKRRRKRMRHPRRKPCPRRSRGRR